LKSKRILTQFNIELDKDPQPLGNWYVHSYCTDPQAPNTEETEHLPCEDNEAISFVYTTKSFIENHNDVFNNNGELRE
jgi:hypothetical protein